MHPSRIIILWITILSSLIFALLGISSQVSPGMDDDAATAASELQVLRSKLLLLESILEEKSIMLKHKNAQLEIKGQIIDKMELELKSLKDAMNTFKNPQRSLEEERVDGLNEKVRLLWDESRKNNFKLHVLEEQAQDSEKSLEAISSSVQKAKDIVTEQWIQIQQLEQALLMAKMRAAKELQKNNPQRWSFLQAIKSLFLPALFQDYRYIFSGTHLPEAFYHLQRFFSYVRNHHFALQHFVKSALESHGLTAFLAHDEIVFFLVSATFVFPLLVMVQFLVGLIR